MVPLDLANWWSYQCFDHKMRCFCDCLFLREERNKRKKKKEKKTHKRKNHTARFSVLDSTSCSGFVGMPKRPWVCLGFLARG